MSKSNTPTSPGKNPFFDEPKTDSDSTGAASSPESSQTPSRPGSAHGERLAHRGNHRVRFGSGEALDNLNNRYTFNLRSPDESPESNRTQQPHHSIAQTPPITLTSPNTSPSGRTYTQAEYFQLPIDVDNIDASIHDKAFVPKTPPRAYSFGQDDELEMNEKYDQFHMEKEQLSAKERAARLSKIGSFSAPNSAHTSPVLNPIKYSVGAAHIQGGVPVDDIPLLDLGEDVGAGEKKQDRPKVAVTKEASDLVRQHTQRGIRSFTARVGTGDTIEPRSGAVTPVAHQHEDYVRQPEQFRGGILSNLLKLYNPHERSHHHSHHGYSNSIASTTGSPPASGRTTPKWYNKSANTSTASLGLLVASGSALATPAAGTQGKGGRPKPKHRPHSGGISGAIKNFSTRGLDDEIKVRYSMLYLLFLQIIFVQPRVLTFLHCR